MEGNPINVPPALTALDKSIEWAMCAKSREYFIDEYGFIYDPVQKDWIPFKLWKFQWDILGEVAAHQLIVALKARQLGMTWLLGDAYPLHHCLFEPIAYCLLFSLTEDEAKDMLARLVGMYKRLPDWMQRKCPIIQSNTTSLEFANGSKIKAYPTTRGDSNAATYAIVDEADLVPDLDVMIGRIKPTIDAGGKLVLLSRVDKRSPKSHFKELFRGARKGENNYHPIFIPWFAHPKRDAAWYETKQREYIHQDDLWEQYPASEQEALAQGYAGLVFPNFSATDNISLEADYDPAYPVEWWVDVGYTNPTAILFAQWRPFRGFPDSVCVFDVVYESQMLPKTLIELALAKGYPPPEYMVYDSAAPTFAAEFVNVRNQHGFDSNIRASIKGVDENIKNTRNYIGDIHNPRLLQIHPRCGIVIDQVMAYHYKKTGLSASGDLVPERVDSHTCFVAGTMVMTSEGEKPIEIIGVGDLVLTRDGFYPVKASALTNENATLIEVLFSNGQRLIATPDHPIYVEGSGFTRFDALTYGIIVLTLENNRNYLSWLKQSSITALPIAVILSQAVAMIGFTLSALAGKLRNVALKSTYIAKFGAITTGIFQRVIISTTLTPIPLTTPLKTWNVSPQKNMRRVTHSLRNAVSNVGNTSPVLPIRYARAMHASLMSNEASKQSEGGKGGLNLRSILVNAVGSHLKVAIQTVRKFVVTNARRSGDVIRSWIGLKSPASDVGQSLVPIAMIKSDSVHVIALKCLDITASVYALEVEHPIGEYYANGVLVKNCDSITYGLGQKLYHIGG